jgi:hypothetical protein
MATLIPQAYFGSRRRSRRGSHGLWLGIASGAVLASLLAEDWIGGLALLVLWAGWHYLRTDEGPPVLALAFGFQWLQVTIGVYYYAVTGRRLMEMDLSDYRPMALIGLGCLIALLSGIAVGLRWARLRASPARQWPIEALSWPMLLLLYATAVALSGVVQEIAWRIPALTQGILALSLFRLVFLFLIFRRLVYPTFRWGLMAPLLLGEVALGYTGYFAGFREVFIVAVLALAERFDRRQARHWVAFGALVPAILLSGVVWTGIKSEYRRDFDSDLFAESRLTRLNRVASLSADWFARDWGEVVDDVDHIVARLWAVYYPALAVSRVPSVLPHTGGDILWQALVHLMEPRALFPEKGVLASDSEMVRKYSGVMVAGEEKGTSIAFGYVGESYVDFGIPWMFLPVFVYGLLMGAAYRWLFRLIRHRELAVGAVTVIFWLSLYLFERSWVKTFGLSVTLVLYLGGATLLVDRLMLMRRQAHRAVLRPFDARGGLQREPARRRTHR